jgi:hypothetical protein
MNLNHRAIEKLGKRGLHLLHGIPGDLTPEVRKASEYFKKVEVWRKREA